MKEFYGKNGAAVDNLREYAIALGLDFDVDMKPVVGYHPQTDRGEKRALLKLVDEAALNEINLNETVLNKSGKVVLDKNTDAILRKAMLEKLNETGGFMELPFQLEFKTKSYTNNSSTVIDDKWFTLPETGQTYSVDGKTHPTYGMPVLPQNLRSGQEFQDGTARAHEYTTKYLDIYRNAITYMVCEKALATETDEQRKQLFMDKMEECQTAAQAKFDEVTSDIADNKFNTKHNVVRDEVMATRIGHSATAVWSADPRLDIDQVSMSFEHAEQLGLVGKDGKLVKEASVLVWRDPILHDGNVRYMSVKIDDSINGVAINPLMDQSFDGDFDGDSVAIVPLKTPEARAQAYTLFSVETNMLNKGAVDKNGNYPIYCQSGLDVASNAYDNPKIKTKFNELTLKINELEEKAARLRLNPNDAELGNSIVDMLPEEARTVKNGNRRTPEASINYLRKQYKRELNDWAHMALDGTATDYVDFTDEKSVMRSLQHIVDTGAKGSQSKLKDAADNMGITYQLGTDGRVDLDTVGVLRDKRGRACSLDTYLGTQREKDEKIEETAAYKADNTSQGGLIAQQGVAAFRDMDLQAALELTYPVTQAILQSKHDPKDAKVKDEIVRFWGKDCWNGYKLTGDWTVTDPIELQTQAHQRITEFVLDPNGEKIPLKERRTYIDDEGKEKVEYVPKVDRYGEPMYEQTYVKCTKDEWIAQMKGMFNAFKVDINPEYIDRLADRMTRDKDAPVTSVSDSVVFYSVQEGGRYTQKPVMGGNGTVVGLTDFAREKGTLLDSVAYFDRLTAVFNEALKTDERYVEAVSKTRNAYTLADSQPRSILTDGIEQGVKAKPLEMELETLKRATTNEEKARRDELRAEIRAIRSQTSISSTFISDNVVKERYGDLQRAETHSDVNTFKKVRKNGEVVEYTTEPKPIGRKDSRLTAERYGAGETYMGESDAEYKSRLALIRGNEPVVEPEAVSKTEAVATATVAAEAPATPTVSEIEFVQEPAKAAKPLNRDAAVTNSIGGTVNAVKANEAKKSQDQLGNGELPPGNS
jgi:DNA-directed RNA polymerase beta' subunit